MYVNFVQFIETKIAEFGFVIIMARVKFCKNHNALNIIIPLKY